MPREQRDEAGTGARRDMYEDRRAGRFWSTRRFPSALVAAVLLGASGLLLYDVVSVRADRPAMYWRRWLARELAEKRLDSTPALIGAAVAMAVGVWLLWLALTPGLRAVLPMRRRVPGVRAGLDRDAAALVLRDRAMEVPGVQSVRVRMKRHKAKARAQSHFRPLDDVRGDLEDALAAGVRDLGLAKEPSIHVKVSRPAKKG
ncbi:alkaline shock response membrane anchor protein AmaP [Streptomyces sp. 8L]|uniref:alkaline shock response membrane anchor protein AmaP n=1 Tax=Streptomyces sp. 8L TaxID=2877242 RepID=UPI0021E5C546